MPLSETPHPEDPHKKLTPEEARKRINEIIGIQRDAFFIPDKLINESDENPALLDSSDQTSALPPGTAPDEDSQEGLAWLAE